MESVINDDLEKSESDSDFDDETKSEIGNGETEK